MTGLEFFGYLASALIALSLMMKSMKKLRWFNLFGAASFATYGFLIDAYPVLALNGFITLIDIYYISQMYFKKDYFEVFRVNSLDTAFVRRFLEYYQDDIDYFFPEAHLDKVKQPHAFFIVRNMLPVGLFVAEPQKDGRLEIKVEYAIPDYRDLKNAFYLYENKNDHFLKYGYRELEIKTTVPEHVRFVKRIGFVVNPNKGDGWFTLALENTA